HAPGTRVGLATHGHWKEHTKEEPWVGGHAVVEAAFIVSYSCAGASLLRGHGQIGVRVGVTWFLFAQVVLAPARPAPDFVDSVLTLVAAHTLGDDVADPLRAECDVYRSVSRFIFGKGTLGV